MKDPNAHDQYTAGGTLLVGVEDRSGHVCGVSERLNSVPVRAIEEAIGFVQKHALHGAQIGAVRRRERWSLPPAAVREAIVNAVAHADYAQRGAALRVSIFDDRLEVENPGLLPFGLTLEDLPRGVSKLRNRVVGRGLVREIGTGPQDPKRRYFLADRGPA